MRNVDLWRARPDRGAGKRHVACQVNCRPTSCGFRAGRPQTEIDVEERTTPAIYRGVRDGLADVGIASEFASHEGLQVWATPWPHEKQLAYAQLLADDLVELSRDKRHQPGVRRSPALHAPAPVRARVSSFETICTLVARSMGVGVVPL